MGNDQSSLSIELHLCYDLLPIGWVWVSRTCFLACSFPLIHFPLLIIATCWCTGDAILYHHQHQQHHALAPRDRGGWGWRPWLPLSGRKGMREVLLLHWRLSDRNVAGGEGPHSHLPPGLLLSSFLPHCLPALQHCLLDCLSLSLAVLCPQLERTGDQQDGLLKERREQHLFSCSRLSAWTIQSGDSLFLLSHLFWEEPDRFFLAF